jgi:hypothetical protein
MASGIRHPVSLLHVADFSTAADFPLAVLLLLKSLLLSSLCKLSPCFPAASAFLLLLASQHLQAFLLFLTDFINFVKQ